MILKFSNLLSKILFGALIMGFSSHQAFSQEIKIVTVDSPNKEVLRKKTENIESHELPMAKEIADKLISALKPLMPAAGLAAPQIGYSKSVFIYTYDRDPKNIEVVINPEFIPIGDNKMEGWEGCFSSILTDGVRKIAKVPRYEKIRVSYLDINGVKVEKELDGFAAKVFQHEYDHLQGIVNIDRKDALVKSFDSQESMKNFMDEVKRADAANYKKPK